MSHQTLTQRSHIYDKKIVLTVTVLEMLVLLKLK